MSASATADSTVVQSAIVAPDSEFYRVDQAQINAQLHQTVLDSVQAVAGLRLNLADEIKAIREAHAAAVVRSTDATTAFEREIRPPQPPQFDRDALTTVASLSLDSAFLDKYTSANDRVRTAIAAAIDERERAEMPVSGGASVGPAGTLSSMAVSQRDVSPTSTVGVTVAPILAELRSDRTRVSRREELSSELRGWRRQVLPLEHDDCVESGLAACELERADPLRLLRAELTKLGQSLAGVEAQIAKAVDERRAALRSEEMATAESLASATLESYEDLLARVRERVKLATDAASDIEDFTTETSGVKKHLDESITAVAAATDDLAHKADSDMEALTRWHTEMAQEAAREHDAYAAQMQSNAKELEKCGAEEAEVWAQMQALVGRLEGLQTRREDLVAARLKETEADRIRGATAAAKDQMHREHARLLEAVRGNLRGASELAGAITDSSARSFAAIERRQWPRKQNDAVVKECARYHDAYLRYVMFAGELVHRAEHRRANVSRLLRGVDFQVKSAAEVLDGDLPLYREQQRRYGQAIEAVDGRLGRYRESMQAQGMQWRPIEACLDDNDVEFQPPELALQELQRDLTKDHCAAVDDLANEEQKLVDHEKRQVRNMANLCDATKANIAEKRLTKSSAKKNPSGSPSAAAHAIKASSDTHGDEASTTTGTPADPVRKLELNETAASSSNVDPA